MGEKGGPKVRNRKSVGRTASHPVHGRIIVPKKAANQYFMDANYSDFFQMNFSFVLACCFFDVTDKQ